MRHARAGHRAGFFVAPACFCCAELLLQRPMVRLIDCCVFATWVRFPKMTDDLRRAGEAPMRSAAESEKVLPIQWLGGILPGVRRACGGEPGIGATARSCFDVASVAPFCPHRSGADQRIPARPDRRAAGARAAQWRRRLRDHGLDPDRRQRAGHARPVAAGGRAGVVHRVAADPRRRARRRLAAGEGPVRDRQGRLQDRVPAGGAGAERRRLDVDHGALPAPAHRRRRRARRARSRRGAAMEYRRLRRAAPRTASSSIRAASGSLMASSRRTPPSCRSTRRLS